MMSEGRNFCDLVNELIKKAANGKAMRYPPVGPRITPNPLLNPLKTGRPIMPSNKYNNAAIKASMGESSNPHNMMMSVCKVMLISPMGIGGRRSVPMDNMLVKRAIRDKRRVFIEILS